MNARKEKIRARIGAKKLKQLKGGSSGPRVSPPETESASL